MADLFDRLITRARGRADAARPALDITDVMFGSPEAELEESPPPVAVPATTEHAARTPDLLAPRAAPLLPPLESTAEAALIVAAPLSRERDSARSMNPDAVRPAPRPLAFATESVAPRDAQPVGVERSAGAPIAPAVTVGRMASAPSDVPTRQPIVVPQPPAGQARQASPSTPALPTRTPPVDPPPVAQRSHDHDQRSDDHDQPAPLARVPRPTAARPAARVSGRPAEAPDPVIRISIGRIDVRATAPAPPPTTAPKSAPSQPRLTLDAFLSRSAAGGPR